MLDVFPQEDEFETPKYSPIWALSQPQELLDITNKLDEIAQASLIGCVTAKADQFDKLYDKMISDFEGSGLKDAEEMMTEIIKGKVALVE